jgi:hypothetical protein
MPILTLQLVPEGAVVDLAIGVSVPRTSALRNANQPVPSPIQIRALIDTGASITCIEAQALQPLGLTPTGTIPIVTPSTGSTPSIRNQLDVSLTLMHPNLNFTVPAIGIVECGALSPLFQGLLGRDLLSSCLFVYDGIGGHFSLAF